MYWQQFAKILASSRLGVFALNLRNCWVSKEVQCRNDDMAEEGAEKDRGPGLWVASKRSNAQPQCHC